MSTIVEVTVPATEFGLESTFERLPDTELRMASLVAHGSDQTVPFLWADTDSDERLCAVLSDDPSVDAVDVLSEFDDNCLLELTWASDQRDLPPVLSGEGATLLDATGYDGLWHLQLFFSAADELSDVYELCESGGTETRVDQITHLTEAAESGYLGLTDRQYQTVFTAYEAGYYEVPRRINQEDLADQLGVSHQAISERLRRAHETVITNGLDYRIYRGDYDVSPQVRHEVRP